MNRFKAFEWDNRKKEKTMMVLEESDIINQIPEVVAVGIDILIMPKKFDPTEYRKEHQTYYAMVKYADYIEGLITEVQGRNGQIIFI